MAARFPYLGTLDNAALKGYSDASLVNLPSKNSADGYVISLVVENNKPWSPETEKTALSGRYHSFSQF